MIIGHLYPKETTSQKPVSILVDETDRIASHPSVSSVLHQKFLADFGEAAAVLARRTDDGIPGVLRGGPTKPVASGAGEMGKELLAQDTSPDYS